jgi:hypothetical protein
MDDKDKLLGWAELVAIFGVFVYFTGFIFRYFYLFNFVISLNEVSDSLYSIFIFSFNIFLYYPIPSCLVFLGIAIAVFFRRKGFWPNVVAMAYLLVSFFLLYALSRRSADISSWEARYSALRAVGKTIRLHHTLKPIDISLKSQKTILPQLLDAIHNKDLYRLLTTDNVLFVLQQPAIPKQEADYMANAVVYRINLEDISSYSVGDIDVKSADESISE